jgi:tetratricopeptide (TPR) repeat protein
MRNLPGCPDDIVLQLGLTLAQLGRHEEAEQPLREYLARHPGHREAVLTLAKTLAKRGGLEAATAMTEEYCRQQRGDIPALRQLGAVYLEAGRIEDAWRVCEQAISESSGGDEALFFKGTLLLFDGRFTEARDIYDSLYRKYPNDIQILFILSSICRECSDLDGAIAYARLILNKDRRNVPALLSLSTVMLDRDAPEARRLMEEAAAIAPNDLSVLVQKGVVLEFEGDKQGAWECVRSAIERGSDKIEAALVTASVAPAIGRTDEAIELLERLATRPGISSSDQRKLRFALTQLCDKAKQPDRAFGHAVIANRLKNARYDFNAHAREINRLKAVYSAAAVVSLPRSSIRSELPVFIVGMPRSGTSLLEQILSCHSKVHARGETTDISKVAERIPYYPDGARNLPQEKLDALAGGYLQRLREMAPTASRVTDKLPGNYMHLGFISQLFPGVRVLHCQRDPRDTCLSNYFLDFSSGLDFTYDLDSLARVYKVYHELMEHWKTALPIPILDVRYEELIADPRTLVKTILDFCGLEWEDACLDFHMSKRQAVTASYDQVRRPLYKSSVARWKPYARHLEPVSRILGLNDDS